MYIYVLHIRLISSSDQTVKIYSKYLPILQDLHDIYKIK